MAWRFSFTAKYMKDKGAIVLEKRHSIIQIRNSALDSNVNKNSVYYK